MSYIGIPPQANFSSGLLDRFTSTTGTTVTLTHDIASENDIVVFVNFVKQDSTTYSVGGTGNKTLTLGGTLVSSDIVEVHYLNIVGQTNAPSSGSVGSSQISADVITGQTALAVAPASTDELLISDAGTLKRVDVSLIGGNNTPAFSCNGGTSETNISDSTFYKLKFDTEVFDSNSNYDTSLYRFTPTVAGKYFFTINAQVDDDSDDNKIYLANIILYKNGSATNSQFSIRLTNTFNTGVIFNANGVEEANGSSDYFEAYMRARFNTSSVIDINPIRFSAYKLIGV
jgi:hypothetical protein